MGLEKISKVLDKICEISIYCLVFIIPFSKAGIEIFGTAAIVCWVLLKGLSIKDKGLRLKKNPIFIAVAVFFIVNLLSCLTSVSVAHSIKALFAKTLEYILFFLIVADIFSRDTRDKRKIYILISVILISTGLACLDGLIQYLTGFDIVLRSPFESGRMSASFLNPNDFGNYLVMFAPIFLVLAAGKNIFLRYRIMAVVSFFILLFCIVFSYSRASYLGFLASILFLTFLKSKKIFLSCILILGVSFFLLPTSVKIRLKEIDSLEKVSTNHRIIMWQEALNIIEDWPILGTGLNTYTLVGPKYKIHPEGGIYPHNSYLHMAAETGILGLTAFLWFLWSIFARGMGLAARGARSTSSDIASSVVSLSSNDRVLILGIMAGLFGFLVNAFFDTTLYALRIVTIFWIMCGLLTVVCNQTERSLV